MLAGSLNDQPIMITENETESDFDRETDIVRNNSHMGYIKRELSTSVVDEPEHMGEILSNKKLTLFKKLKHMCRIVTLFKL